MRQLVEDFLLDVLALKDPLSQTVNFVALQVHDVVVFLKVLADLEVARLDAFLALAMAPVTKGCEMTSPSCGAKPVHDRRDALRAEYAHEIVVERQEKLRGPGIALASGPAAQLVVDTARLVALGADDVQPAELDLHFSVLLVESV